MAHVKYETLLDYMEGHLPALEAGEVDTHLAQACEMCERRLRLLRKALRRASEDSTVAPPAEVLKRAVDIPLTHGRPAQTRPWERLIAALTFDSYKQPSAALTRGAARERQLLFSADPVDIDLQIKPSSDGYDLIGQVLGEADNPAAFVSLHGNAGRVLKAAETDPSGTFAFRGIHPGLYDLVFDLGTHDVAVVGIEVAHD